MALFSRFSRTITEEIGNLKSALELIKPGAVANLTLSGNPAMQLEQLKSAVAGAVGHGETDKAELDVRAKLAQAEAERDQAQGTVAQQSKEIARLKAELEGVDDRIHSVASMKALEIAQTQGCVPPVTFKVNQNPTGASGNTYLELWEKFHAITDPAERNAFYQKNRAAMRRDTKQ
jgi:hypothetical protein